MTQPWFLRPTPTPEEQRARAKAKLREMVIVLLVTAPGWAIGASALGLSPLRSTIAFTSALPLWIGGFWLFSRPVPMAQRGRRRVLLALGAVAGVLPGLSISGLVGGAPSVGSALIGALCGWAFMAWQIWDAHILPTDAPRSE